VICGLPDDFIFLEVLIDMEDCIVIVDNGFFKLVKKEFEVKTKTKKKFLQTFRNICKNENLFLRHLFFCAAPPHQSKNPTKKEGELKRGYDNLIRLLNYKKWITVREGRCQRLKINGEYEYFQKGVDSWIVADLCRFKRQFPSITKVILISSDSDFAPIIKDVQKSDNLEVILYTYFDKKRKSCFSLSNHLRDVCSKWVKLKGEDFD